MHRIDLDLIASPFVFPQQLEIANKVPPCGAHLAQLGCVLNEWVADRDTPVARGER